jgi:hypothetical protein
MGLKQMNTKADLVKLCVIEDTSNAITSIAQTLFHLVDALYLAFLKAALANVCLSHTFFPG